MSSSAGLVGPAKRQPSGRVRPGCASAPGLGCLGRGEEERWSVRSSLAALAVASLALARCRPPVVDCGRAFRTGHCDAEASRVGGCPPDRSGRSRCPHRRCAKLASVDPTCAPDKSLESQNYFNNVYTPALADNYAAPAIGLLETYGPGSWTMQLKQAFTKAGPWLLCGYTEHFGVTVAAAQLTVTVASAGGPTPTPTPANPDTTGDVKPAVTKKPRVVRTGRRLSCSRGTWTNAATYRYAWVVNGKTKRGARRRTLAVTRSLRGRKVACRVTASNEYGTATAASRPYRVR